MFHLQQYYLFPQGAAFGFNVIATKAGEQLAPFLPQLLPRLYRYQFDPNIGIRQAMTSIWNALVTDRSAVSEPEAVLGAHCLFLSVSQSHIGMLCDWSFSTGGKGTICINRYK